MATERAEVFELLAKLVWYLVSGKSHVGYLFNHKENPIHIAVSFPRIPRIFPSRPVSFRFFGWVEVRIGLMAGSAYLFGNRGS